MLILRYIQKSISSLRLYDWILSDIPSPLQQLFCEGPDPFDSSLQARFLLLMLLDRPVLAISVPSSFPECRKGQVRLRARTRPQVPALKAGVPQGSAGTGHGCSLPVQGRMQPVFCNPAQHLCLAAKHSDKNRQRGLLKQTCRISGLSPDAQDSVGNSRSYSHSV